MTKPIIFLDMDGVCVNFVQGALRAVGRPQHTIRQWNFFADLGMTEAHFWNCINAGGEDFWADLDEYPHFGELYDALANQGPVYFLSSPSQSHNCVAGKVRWLQGRFGQDFRRYIFGRDKHLLAGPERILIDDSEANCERWREAGGVAILFPQPWNSAPHDSFAPPWQLPET